MRIFRKREAKGTGFERPEGMPEALHRLLSARGISSAEEARAFLKPNRSMLHSPALLRGATEAALLLKDAIRSGKKICVYGDYDVDGVSASAILILTLGALGADAQAYLPSRHDEGYGLNEGAVRKIADEFQLLITVDCGITSVSLVALARELGLTVIVTDHHQIGSELPDCTVVNPLLGGYPDPYLCGAGVAFKLSEALLGREAAMEYIDLAALATVADIVPLTGENRVIVKLGLDAMNRNPRLGLSALREGSGLNEKPFTAGMLGFQIGPRLNASGRVGSARRALDLLTATDPAVARSLADELNAENALRKKYEEEILAQSLDLLADFDFHLHRAIVLSGEGWNSGVIGLAASRLVERFNYPTILISLEGETGVGSCRSIPGVDIHAALNAVSDFMVKFGGHKQAAGLTIRRAEIPAFADALDQYLALTADPALYVPVSEYDLEARFSELDAFLVALMDSFAPAGMGNPAPVFRTRAKVIEARRVGKDGAHLSLRLTDGTNTVRAIAFREGANLGRFAGKVDALYAPFLNEFGGRRSVELEIKAIVSAGESEILTREGADGDALLAAFLTEMIYNRAYSENGGKPIRADELSALLAASPQGTLIVAASAACAAGFQGLDLLIGRYPDDPRAFNAICVLPEGDVPKDFRRIVYAGMPAPDGGLQLNCPSAEWIYSLPGIEELRIAYVALRRMLARPLLGGSLAACARSLTDECALDFACAAASILVLVDVGLIAGSGDWNLSLGKTGRVDPMTSAAYRAVRALKKGGVTHEQSGSGE